MHIYTHIDFQSDGMNQTTYYPGTCTPVKMTVTVVDTYDQTSNGSFGKVHSIMQVKTVVKKRDAGKCCSFCNKRYTEREEAHSRWDVFDCRKYQEPSLGWFIICSDCREVACDDVQNLSIDVFFQYADDDEWYAKDGLIELNYG
jgi:ribosomal protein L37AE/L43A